MVIKILYYFIAIFFAVMFFLFSQDPYLLELGVRDPKISIMEMYDVQDHELNEKEVVSILNSQKVVRYNDRDEFFKIDTVFRKSGFINSLSANKGVMKNSIIYLNGSVNYVRDDGFTFFSDEAQYHQKEEILKGSQPFTLSDNRGKMVGKSFEYNLKEKSISANDIYSIIETEKL